MMSRIATGLVLAPLVVWLLLAGPLWLITTVLALAVALSAHELLTMFDETRGALATRGAAFAALVAATPMLAPGFTLTVSGLVASVLLALCLLRPDDLLRQSRAGAMLVATIGYVGVMGAALTAIAALPAPSGAAGPFAFGPSALLAHFILVFSGDTGAYFAGRTFGRHKLYPLVSPKKTIEGSIGGLVASVGGATLFCHWAMPQLAAVEVALAAVIVGAMAQIGDLAESMFKRATATKDSGRILPGHGGMLDRLDGALFAAPWTLAWLTILHGHLAN